MKKIIFVLLGLAVISVSLYLMSTATDLDVYLSGPQNAAGDSLFYIDTTGGLHGAGTNTFTGDTTLSGTTVISGAATLSSSVTSTAKRIKTAGYCYSITQTGSIVPTSEMSIIFTTGPTITSTCALNFISTNTYTDGTLFTLVGGTGTLTLTDDGGLAGSGLALGAATRGIGPGDTLTLWLNKSIPAWVEISYANNQ